MGFLSDALALLIPERKAAIAASIPTWQQGNAQNAPNDYYRNARDGYMLDEVVYSCVELRATSLGEPPVCAWRPGNDEKLDEHPAIELLNHPNPFMGYARLWATVGMC